MAYLLQGLILGTTAAAQPGPLQAFLLSLIARDGWRRTMPAAFAPLISDGPIILIVLLILTRLPGWLLSALQLAGGTYLLFLAWGASQSFKAGAPADSGEAALVDGSVTKNILKAALMNFLSLGPYIYWATVAGPIFIEAWRQAPTSGLAFLLGFYAALIGGLMIFILIFGAAGKVDPRVNRALGLVSVVGLFAFGLYQIVNGVAGLGAGVP
ncbi:MAG: LysE family transporter [Anaerolineae bacterium]|nr:LysE family transporter [Anaerolineae bacterium]